MRPLARITTTAIVLVAAAVAAALGAKPATAAPTLIYANVGPSYTITLKTAGGVAIRTLRAGRAYTVVVRDQSEYHNFRLTGSGVNRATSIAFVGTVRWNVTFRAGTYTYSCDPHDIMRGSVRAIAA